MIELDWKQVSDVEWAAFYNVGTYHVKQTRGGVFPRYVLTFESHEIIDVEQAKRMAARFAATDFRVGEGS